jgi:hypothetical protein
LQFHPFSAKDSIMNKRCGLLALALAPVVLWVVACGGNDGIDDRLGTADPKVRLVHAIPAGPNLTLFRDNQAQAAGATNVAYKGASVYSDVSANTHQMDVRTASAPVLTVGSVTFDAHRGNKYTFIAVPDAGSVTTAVMIDDPFEKGLTTDNARLRAFNAAFNTPNVDVYLTAPGVSLTSVTPVLPAAAYKQAVPGSGTNSTEVEGGAYSLRLTIAGTKTVVFTSPVTLDKNADWLIVPVPASVTPGDMKVLIVKSDDGAPSIELSNTP